MLNDIEVVWEWKERAFATASEKMDLLEERPFRDVVYRIWARTKTEKGEGRARVSDLVTGYDTWKSLLALTEGRLDYLEVGLLQPKGKGNEDIPEMMMRVWNECGKFAKVKVLNSERRTKCRARWAEFPEPKGQFWDDVVKKAAASRFLTGTNNRHWCADFDWMLQVNSAAKIYEGKYDDRTVARAAQGGDLEALKNFGWESK